MSKGPVADENPTCDVFRGKKAPNVAMLKKELINHQAVLQLNGWEHRAGRDYPEIYDKRPYQHGNEPDNQK